MSLKLGAKPPSSPTAVLNPFLCNTFLRLWNTSEPIWIACEKFLAFTGIIINSWKAIGASECAPALMMFIIGTGKV